MKKCVHGIPVANYCADCEIWERENQAAKEWFDMQIADAKESREIYREYEHIENGVGSQERD